MAIVGVVLVTILLVRRIYHGRVRRAPPWDCGFPLQTPRMQDTAEGFGQPIRQIFEPFFRMRARAALAVRLPIRAIRVTVEDRSLVALALPADRRVLPSAVARLFGLMQRGRISVYLLYSFVTLLALLLFVL